jgi:hypothetical protein
MAQMKKPAPLKPKTQIIAERAAAAKKKPVPIKPKVSTTPAPRTTPKMTPQDAAMKKLLEKKYGKIYG